jgi:hypothetical protein
MRITELTINIERQFVFVRCLFNVQGVEHPIVFTLRESDLYSAAAARGADSWENEDVISVAQAQLMLTLSV